MDYGAGYNHSALEQYLLACVLFAYGLTLMLNKVNMIRAPPIMHAHQYPKQATYQSVSDLCVMPADVAGSTTLSDPMTSSWFSNLLYPFIRHAKGPFYSFLIGRR